MKSMLGLLAALTFALPVVQTARAAENKPALWAVYCSWYETAGGPHGRWTHWSDDKTKSPTPPPKSRAQPLIGYCDSDDAALVRWHVRRAKAVGIKAFLASWWGDANLSGAAFEKVILPVVAEEKWFLTDAWRLLTAGWADLILWLHDDLLLFQFD
jgi:hypothetical protein